MINSKFLNGLKSNKSVLFLQQNWLFILMIAFALPYIVRYFKSQELLDQKQALNVAEKKNTAENAKANPTIINAKAKIINKKYPNLKAKDSERLKAVAASVANALGTNVEDNHILFSGTTELFNVRAWSEDEASVVKALKTTTGTFPIVEDYYYSLFTRSRNLKNDLHKYLSKEDISQLRVTYKKAGYSWI